MQVKVNLILCHVEKIDHLMLHCHVVKELRNIVFSLHGVHWVIPCSVKPTVIWNMISHCIVCYLTGEECSNFWRN